MYRLLVVRVNPYNDTAMATGSGREMVRRAAFYPRRGGGGVFWAGVRRREARLPRGVLSGWERRRWRASGGSGVRRSSSGGGGCGDDRPSRAGGAGLVLSWAGRWSVGVAAMSSSGELVVVPSWWWWGSGVFVRLGVFSDTAGILLGPQLGAQLSTACVGVISSYLRVLIGPKVMTISLSVVDWLRTR